MTAAAALALVAAAATGTIERGGLELRVPAGWHETAPVREARAGVTVSLGPRDGGGSKLLLTLLPQRQAVDTRALVEAQGRKLLPTVVERSLAVEELRGECGYGHYYALTDRAPVPGEFAHMLQGVIALEARVVSFTLLARSVDPGERAAVLELLRSVCPVRTPPR